MLKFKSLFQFSAHSVDKSNIEQPFTKLIPLVAALSLILGGCADFGGKGLSLLTPSAVLDPLEVPPDLTPLPENTQFQLPRELDASQRPVDEIPREQFRNYESWIAFEEFKKFYDADQGVGVSPEEYKRARDEGQGLFKVITLRTDQGTVRVQVRDDIESVWNYLSEILLEMGLEITEKDFEQWKFKVENIPVEELPSFLQRVGFKEYSGSVNAIQLIPVGNSITEVAGLTFDGVEVNYDAGEDFFKRLRLYMLTLYEHDSDPYASAPVVAEVPSSKKQIVENDGQRKIVVLESFNSTWDRVGKIIRASGMSIIDLNRSAGVMYVSFHTAKTEKKRKWQFWKRAKNVRVEEQFQVIIRGEGQHSEISVVLASNVDEGLYQPDNVLDLLYERLTI